MPIIRDGGARRELVAAVESAPSERPRGPSPPPVNDDTDSPPSLYRSSSRQGRPSSRQGRPSSRSSSRQGRPSSRQGLPRSRSSSPSFRYVPSPRSSKAAPHSTIANRHTRSYGSIPDLRGDSSSIAPN